MRTITKTELNQRPSEVMKIVEAGEVVRITLRGEVVARIVPEPRSGTAIERLVEAGLLIRPRNPRPLSRRRAGSTVESVRDALADINSDASTTL